MTCEVLIYFGENDAPDLSLNENKHNIKTLDMIDTFGDLKMGVGQFIQSIIRLGASPNETAIDLLILASSVFLADKSYSRDKYSSDGWTRQFMISLPVHDPDMWSDNERQLSDMLQFLTGDLWRFKFRARPSEYTTLKQASEELELTKFDCVTLFSGGLDSLIGTIDLLSKGKRPLLISHHWDTKTGSVQTALDQELKNKYGEESFKRLRGRIGINRSAFKGVGTENTQRSRSFLFYSMATVASDALQGTNNVIIPENGLIALNVPMDRVRLGSLSTRTAHPHFIKSMNHLTVAIGMTAIHSNPYRFKTKGEMALECGDIQFLAKVAEKSMSCSAPDKYRWVPAPIQHCGHCLPCIIRRASLLKGLSIEDETPYYLNDPTERNLDSKSAQGRDIRSFIFAYNIIHSAPEKARFIVRKPGPLPIEDIEDYAALYKRGMSEVATFLTGVKSGHG